MYTPLIFIDIVIALFLFIKFLENKGEYILLIFSLVLPFYTTFLSIVYKFSDSYVLIKFLQAQKEIFIFLLLLIFLLKKIYSGKIQLRLNFLDWLLISFALLNVFYFLLPMGGDSIVKLLSLRANLLFVLLYFVGKTLTLSASQIKFFFTILTLVGALAGLITIVERISGTSIQELTGYSRYMTDFFNTQPKGNYGLTWTFETNTGIRRYSGIFSNPLELASSVLITFLAGLAMLNLNKGQKISFAKEYIICLFLIFISLLNTVSRASFIAFLMQIMLYLYLFKHKMLLKVIAGIMVMASIIVLSFASRNISAFIISTITFENPSSVGHLVEWIDAVEVIKEHPFGLGLGASGKAALLHDGEKIGGENQYLIFGVQIGIPGIIIYSLIILYAIKNSLKAHKLEIEPTKKWLFIVAGLCKFGLLIPLFTSNLETFAFISYTSWILVGYANMNLYKLNESRNRH